MRRTKKFCMFTKEQDEMLIELVSNNPVLYDPSNLYYKDIVLRDRTWTQIGKQVDRSAEDCKTRWRSIRDLYHKKKKGGKGGLWCLETNKAKWDYADQMSFMDDFFIDRKIVRRTTDECEDATNQSEQGLRYDEHSATQAENIIMEREEVEISPDLTQNSLASGRLKRQFTFIEPLDNTLKKSAEAEDRTFRLKMRRSEERNQLIREVLGVVKKGNHPIKTFFDSMAQTVMNFPPSVQAEAKLRVCKVITEIECRVVADTQT